MNRWTFIGGLTVTLLLLLVLSGFCIWATRGLTGEIGSVINQNYDGIRALRELCSSLNRLNAYYLVATDVSGVPDTLEVFKHEHEIVDIKLAQLLRRPASDPAQREKLKRLQAHCHDYFATLDEMLTLKRQGRDRYYQLSATLTALTGDITSLADQIVDLTEAAILARRDAAVSNGRRVTIIAVGFVIFSLGVYVLTSVRLTRALFEPLRRLRDSIQQVSDRRFDTLVPLEGGEELGQIASSFNRMAAELRRYISETDDRAVQSARVNRAILEALPYPVFLVDRDFQVRLANPRAEALSAALGIPGMLPGELRRQIDGAAAREADIVSDEIRRAVRLPLTQPDRTGATEADYLPQIFRMPGAFDGVDGWAVLLVDVTRLRRMDEAKTRALSTLGHEVKTPVAGMRMTLQLLLDGGPGPLTPVQRELVEAGRDDCERLLAVLRSLLELAQLESGRTTLTLARHPAVELLKEAHGAHAEAIHRRGAELQLEASEDLPDVMAEPSHALRVLDNFLTNAGKYGVPGEAIVLRGQRRGDGFVRFSVVNRIARALAEAEQARIFDPFFRRPGESADGTGLGLAISREIAAAHGGRIGVFCPPDDGTVEFFFDLRAVTARTSNSAPPAAEQTCEAEQKTGSAQPATKAGGSHGPSRSA
jgi:NtrC-family two-component system sensor histidine kinase KinB